MIITEQAIWLVIIVIVIVVIVVIVIVVILDAGNLKSGDSSTIFSHERFFVKTNTKVTLSAI